jgi:hypothetical protein
MSGNTVILLRSTDTGAPVLSGTAGALIALLDACLQDGYNSKTIQSITRSGAVATVTYATAHNYANDNLTKVQISGCDQAEYNGIQQITYVSSTVFTFAVAGTPASGSGTMVSKVAPLGWSKAFAGTNNGAYRSNEVTGTRLYLRVDDNNSNADTYKTAFMRGYEAMTDANTGTGPFPTVAQMANGVYALKSDASSSAARTWVLVGDGFEFFLFTAPYLASYPNQYEGYHFGDPKSEMASDPYGCLLIGSTGGIASYPNQQNAVISHLTSLTTQTGHYMARLYTQIGASIQVGKLGNIVLGSSMIGGGLLAYPAQQNNGLYVAPLYIYDGSVVRAQLACVYQPLHLKPLGHGVAIAANVSPINRRIYAVALSNNSVYEIHVDIDGPWR